jgi:ribonuclease BN (tRNA processing enzyme)
MTTWTIGSATIAGGGQLGITNQPCEKYFRNFERDVLERHLDWLAPGHYSPQHDRFVTSVHSWLIRLGDLTILLDTCGGNHKDRPWTHRFHQLDTPYLQRLRAAGAAPEDVDLVLCTHLHADHVGWLAMDAGADLRTRNTRFALMTPIGTCARTGRRPRSASHGP